MVFNVIPQRNGALFSLSFVMLFVTKPTSVNVEDKAACTAVPLSLQQKVLQLTDLLTNHIVVTSIPMCRWLD